MPIMILEAQNASVESENLSFVTRSARFGSSINTARTPGNVNIGMNGSVRIHAVDMIEISKTVNVSDGGKLDLECEKNISIGGTEVKDGGEIVMEAVSVRLENGFSVKKGAKCKINKYQ